LTRTGKLDGRPDHADVTAAPTRGDGRLKRRGSMMKTMMKMMKIMKMMMKEAL